MTDIFALIAASAWVFWMIPYILYAAAAKETVFFRRFLMRYTREVSRRYELQEDTNEFVS